jgi:predicted enzyme related to lactoylglutathione lyase
MAGEIVHIEFPAADADRAQKFWNGLFGWEFEATEGEMDYRVARLWDGKLGIAVFPSEQKTGHPNYYYAVSDIEAARVKVEELGGAAEEKRPVPALGWFCVCKDSEGNEFHLWQVDGAAA